MLRASRLHRSWIASPARQRLRYASAPSIALANKADDLILRQVFDAPIKTIGTRLRSPFTKQRGLLNNDYLTGPAGFPHFARDSLKKAEFLADYVSRHFSEMSGSAIITAFDRLSDTLCAVLDLAEFVRNSHPDNKFIEAAETAYEILYEFMNTLNTHTGLFAALTHVDNNEKISRTLDAQQRSVLDVLLADFYRSGVHLDAASRQSFMQLSAEINRAERIAFTDYLPERDQLLFPVPQAKGLWPNLDSRMITADGKHIRVPTSGWEADSAMQRLDQSSSRQALMAACQTARNDQVENLNGLFKARAELAKLVGQESCGDSILARQMAKSPKQVETFLLNFGNKMRPIASAEYDLLKKLKMKHLQLKDLPEFHKWDEDYYSALYVRNLKIKPAVDVSSYLSVGTVIQGLSRLFEKIYGVRFVNRDIDVGEGWHQDVRRLDVISETDGLIGSLYCDLFSRPGKSPGLAAHFTLRCGRRIDQDELLPGEIPLQSGVLTGSLKNKTYQLPVIALQCAFSPAPQSSFATLSFHEVSTLAHEMGHAIHSMLGTTDFQTVSGTRVAADFVELPSQIMESFMESDQIWPLFARHYSSDAPASPELMRRAIQGSNNLMGIQRYRQFQRALLDQRYHSSLAQRDDFDSTRILSEMEHEFGLTCKTDPTYPWQVQFTHFAGYGGTYYSYMFDKAIADKIWSEVFAANPLSREAGENFKENFLRYGGSRDPWQCLADVLAQPDLAKGDSAAMAEVGKWSMLHS